MKQNCQVALYEAVYESVERFVGFGNLKCPKHFRPQSPLDQFRQTDRHKETACLSKKN